MYPVAHAIVALLPTVGYVLLRDGRLPSLRFVGVVIVGSQFPDLIDKPLAHQFGLIPSGRVFMHSLPIALPVLVVVGLYGWLTERPRLGWAFVVAYLSHLLADNYRAFVGSTPQLPSDLLWPFAAPIARPIEPHWAGPDDITIRLWTILSVVVLTLVGYRLVVDVREQLGAVREQ